MPREFHSAAFLATTLQVPLAQVRQAIDALGFNPRMLLNGIAYYSGNQAGHIHAWLINSRAIEAPIIHGVDPNATVTLADDED